MLALIVVSTVVVGTIMFRTSNYYAWYGERILAHPFKTVLYDRPIWDYYSKTPKWFDPKQHFSVDFWENFYSTNSSIARARFVSEESAENEVSYSFYVNDWIRKERESQRRDVTLTRKDLREFFCYSLKDFDEIYTSYRSEYQLMLSYYGAEYEKGQEYLIIYDTGYRLKSLYYFAPLDGEYPYIEVYPGATRYDATYFGAESKYVDKDEFLRLIKEAINNPPAR